MVQAGLELLHLSTYPLFAFQVPQLMFLSTVNIHTHSLGALFFGSLIPLHLLPSSFPSLSPFLPTPKWATTSSSLGLGSLRLGQGVGAIPVPPTIIDKIAMTTYLCCAVSCLGLSSWFHTVQCCDERTCNLAHRGDYVSPSLLFRYRPVHHK